MKALEMLISRLVVASVFPMLLFLAGWWASIGQVPDERIALGALAGLVAGVLVDVVCFRKQIAKPYEVSHRVLVLIFLFYSICTLGFFMGVPVFNLLFGAAAGFYAGRRLRYTGADRTEATRSIKLVSMLAAAVMAAVCFGSAYIALRDPTDTARNLQGMLSIRSFEVTPWAVGGLIAVGGPALILVQYVITKAGAEMAYGRPKPTSPIR